MSKLRRALLAAGLLAPLALLVAGAPGAQAADAYPSRPVRLVVPFPPGGSNDLLAREIADALAQRLKAPFVVENKGGAGGAIGIEAVAKAPADGYTILVVSNSLVTAPALNRQLRFDAVKDFAPIALIAELPTVLAVTPDVPGTTLAEALAHIKANPGKLNYASAGIGAPQHLSTEYLKSATGADIVHIPLQGQGQMLTEMLGGRVQLMIGVFSTAQPYFAKGSLKALATGGARRTPAAPNLPTIAEAGVPGYAVQWWLGALAPAGTPPDIVGLLNREILALGQDTAFRAKLAAAGIDWVGSGPAEFGRTLARDLALWTKVVADAGIEAK
ncbi:tripartite-type tricarboxylate transporter receptor subunit TctC [Azospirillum agricola]|uniref:tripartite tricarboxylate transporter substrate binding protein n=1 Tax=Azospirillum agricola TaxID=1720247 RepID=UPI001AE3A9C2|nr:tripartite tricarboxylate transporter substrate binding protein [Azospirillum agricola]MBP2228649.1 tripartite-type tricarboxylate transporter receptor subunit TctC [Azospirillum agricola]